MEQAARRGGCASQKCVARRSTQRARALEKRASRTCQLLHCVPGLRLQVTTRLERCKQRRQRVKARLVARQQVEAVALPALRRLEHQAAVCRLAQLVGTRHDAEELLTPAGGPARSSDHQIFLNCSEGSLAFGELQTPIWPQQRVEGMPGHTWSGLGWARRARRAGRRNAGVTRRGARCAARTACPSTRHPFKLPLIPLRHLALGQRLLHLLAQLAHEER